MAEHKTAVVIPNWNGKEHLGDCLDSLLAQTVRGGTVIVVDNGSVDGSVEFIQQNYPEVVLVTHRKNLGFTGGVNAGIKKAMELGMHYVALLNNDAVADKDWLKRLILVIDRRKEVGIATSKICDFDKTHLDSTGDQYTIWGLPFPRGRGEQFSDKYDKDTFVFGASGGASIYKIKMLEEIGLFDQNFFAYYEDIDLSFRAQLAGWKVAYVPTAVVYHQISATSSKIRGFASYHTLKNLPLLFWKNVPLALMPKVLPRLFLAYWSFAFRTLLRGQLLAFFKGILMAILLWPKKLWQRRAIQKSRKVTPDYIDSIITHDLPPNAGNLRRLRSAWWKLRRKSAKSVDDQPVVVEEPNYEEMKLVIDARESGTTTGRYIDKLIEYLYKLEPEFEVQILTKATRLDFVKKLAPHFKTATSDFKEFTFAEQLGFKKQLDGLNADLVHFNAPQQPIRYGGKKITTVHDLTTLRFNNPSKNWLVYKFKQRVYARVIKRVVKKSAHIITPSKYVKDDLIKFSGIDPKKITIVHEAADKITDKPEAVKRLAGKQFIMYVGRPTPHKNLEGLIDAFALLSQKQPQLVLALAGRMDSNYRRIQKLVEKKGLTKSVVFTDFVSEGGLRWMYESCAVYVFPSFSEGFGLPGLEAMAHGAAVVASHATCLPEIYGDGALYFNPHDAQDMADKILQVIEEPDLAKRLISSGYEQASKYSWSDAAEQTLEIYKQALRS